MADINELKGVFGGVQFENNNKTNNENSENNNNIEIDNTSYFGENAESIGTNNVFGNFEINQQKENQTVTENNSTIFQPIEKEQALVKQGIWSKIKNFLFQEIDLTAPIKIHFAPNRKKIENQVNDVSNQKNFFDGIKNWLKGKNQKEINNIEELKNKTH